MMKTNPPVQTSHSNLTFRSFLNSYYVLKLNHFLGTLDSLFTTKMQQHHNFTLKLPNLTTHDNKIVYQPKFKFSTQENKTDKH